MPRVYALVFAVALATRLVAAAKVLILDRDGVWYLLSAGYFAHGDWKSGLAFHYPPAFPVLAALAERLGLDPEPAGLAVSALAGAFAALFAAGIAARYGERAAWVAGLTVALHPAAVEQGCAVTADALFASCVLGALLAAQRSRWGISGVLAAASYLARPEGIVAIFMLALRARRRAPWLLAGASLLVVPYMVAIKSEPMMAGSGAGEWKLTRKREVLRESGAANVFPRGDDGARHFSLAGATSLAEATAERLVRHARHVGRSGLELLLVLGVLIAIRRRAPLGVPDLDVALALLLAYSLIRDDQRYGTIAFTLLLPWFGVWLSRLARERWLLAVVLLVPLLPATRARHTKKVTWREAGVLCTGYERIASTDPRVAFYAHAPVHLDLSVMTIEEARARGAQVAVVREVGAVISSTRTVLLDHGPEVEAVRIVPLQ